jgi:hypothetical protein
VNVRYHICIVIIILAEDVSLIRISTSAIVTRSTRTYLFHD